MLFHKAKGFWVSSQSGHRPVLCPFTLSGPFFPTSPPTTLLLHPDSHPVCPTAPRSSLSHSPLLSDPRLLFFPMPASECDPALLLPNFSCSLLPTDFPPEIPEPHDLAATFICKTPNPSVLAELSQVGFFSSGSHPSSPPCTRSAELSPFPTTCPPLKSSPFEGPPSMESYMYSSR